MSNPARDARGMYWREGAKSTTVAATADRREHARPLADRPGLLVDRRARQRPGAGEALEETPGQVRRPFAQTLLVDVELLSGCGRQSPLPSPALRATPAGRWRTRCRPAAAPGPTSIPAAGTRGGRPEPPRRSGRPAIVQPRAPDQHGHEHDRDEVLRYREPEPRRRRSRVQLPDGDHDDDGAHADEHRRPVHDRRRLSDSQNRVRK